MDSNKEFAVQCPVCGGAAKNVEISICLGDGAVEPITICACEDAKCDAYYPTARRTSQA
jgi:hypothetical protein